MEGNLGILKEVIVSFVNGSCCWDLIWICVWVLLSLRNWIIMFFSEGFLYFLFFFVWGLSLFCLFILFVSINFDIYE